MFGRGGYFRGGTLLVSGSAGTGKSSLAGHFVDAACRRGERCVYFAFEESPDQVMRNMRSIGLDLAGWVGKGFLRFVASRPASFGLETHIGAMVRTVDEFKPRVVVVDPVSSFDSAGTSLDVRSMLMRLVDLLKSRQVTTLFTSLTHGGQADESVMGVSSLMDSWILLHNIEQGGERTRALSIIKSRGMKHSNQARELLLTDKGADLVDVFVGPEGAILTGSARLSQQSADRAAADALQQDIGRKKAALLRRRKAVEAAVAQMEADLAAEIAESGVEIDEAEANASGRSAARDALAAHREAAGGSVARSNGGRK